MKNWKWKLCLVLLVLAMVAIHDVTKNQWRRKLDAANTELASVKADRYNLAYCLHGVMTNTGISVIPIPFEGSNANWTLDMKRTNGAWRVSAGTYAR